MKKIISLIILLFVILQVVSCKEIKYSPSNTTWYSDEIELYVFNGKSKFKLINFEGILKNINNGIVVNCYMHYDHISLQGSQDTDLFTPSEYKLFAIDFPYHYQDDTMILDCTDSTTNLFEPKIITLKSKKLVVDSLAIPLKSISSIQLKAVDGSLIISKYDNIVTVGDIKRYYRFQMNWDFTFIFIVYSDPVPENVEGYVPPIENYDFDLIAIGRMEFKDGIYTLIFERDNLFNYSLDGLQFTSPTR